MSIALQISFLERHVVIIGAGKVAFRKAKTFLADGAQITLIAPIIHPDIYEYPVNIIQKEYDKTDIIGAFLVIAATNQRHTNEQIVQDAKRAGTLVMCVHNDLAANVHSMVQENDESYTIAMSTNGFYPSANRYLIKNIQQYIHDNYLPRLLLLKQIRASCIQQQISFIFHDELLLYDKRLLEIILSAFEQKKLCLFVYHGTSYERVQDDIIAFEEKVQGQHKHTIIGHAFLTKVVYPSPKHNPIQVFSYEQIMPILHKLTIQVTVIPMLFHKGQYYQYLESIANMYRMHFVPSPFQHILQKIDLHTITQKYIDNGQKLIFVYHKSLYIDKYKNKSFPDHVFFWSIREFKELIGRMKKAYIYPLFVLKGKHYTELQAYETSSITIHATSLIQEQPIQEALFHYLFPYIDHIVF